MSITYRRLVITRDVPDVTFAGFRIPDSGTGFCLPYIGRHLQTVRSIWMKFGTIAQCGTRRIVAKFRPNLACRSSAIAYGRSLDGCPAIAGFVSGSVHRQPFRNGLTDSYQIWQTTVNLSSTGTDQIPSRYVGPFASETAV